MRTIILLCLIATTIEYCSPIADPADIFNYTEGVWNVFSLPAKQCWLEFGCRPFPPCNVNEHAEQSSRPIFNIPHRCREHRSICCKVEMTMIENATVQTELTFEGCGHRNVNGLLSKSFVSKENETEYGEFPWMVVVLKKHRKADKIENLYLCGGSLIHPKVVLTAAHCVQAVPANVLKIRAGEWNTSTRHETFPHQDRNVSEVVIHEHFNEEFLYNDIALLFLKTSVELAQTVKTICLPPAQTHFDSTRCVATGWGKDKLGGEGKYQMILKKIDLPVVPREQCQAALKSTPSVRQFELNHSFICAGGEIGKHMCEGDDGSPLVCPIQGTRDRYQQIGIVAWAIGCGNNIPGVYASVADLREWLDEKLLNRNIESSFYTP